MKEVHVIAYGQELRYFSYEVSDTSVRLLESGSGLSEGIIAQHLVVEIVGDPDIRQASISAAIHVETLRFSACSIISIERWLTVLAPIESLKFHNCQLPNELNVSPLTTICISRSIGGYNAQWSMHAGISLQLPIVEGLGKWLQSSYFSMLLSGSFRDWEGNHKRAQLKFKEVGEIQRRSATHILTISDVTMTTATFRKLLAVESRYITINNALVKGALSSAKAECNVLAESLTLRDLGNSHDLVACAVRSMPHLKELNLDHLSLTALDLQAILDHPTIDLVSLSIVSVEPHVYSVSRRIKVIVSSEELHTLPHSVKTSKLIEFENF